MMFLNCGGFKNYSVLNHQLKLKLPQMLFLIDDNNQSGLKPNVRENLLEEDAKGKGIELVSLRAEVEAVHQKQQTPEKKLRAETKKKKLNEQTVNDLRIENERLRNLII
jgi:hypothetical protein